jgi:DNA-binding transcriptional regulator YiaG
MLCRRGFLGANPEERQTVPEDQELNDVEHRNEGNLMNPNPTTSKPVLLHIRLRRRREELCLLQRQIAEILGVTTECVGLWESGQRRMELSKLPRIAKALKLDGKQLCAQGLLEFHPAVYAALFGNAAVQANTP